MIAMTLAEIAQAVRGEIHDGDDAIQVSAPAFVDSRIAEDGGLFVAVPGERVDGHDFARAAVVGGAAAVLGSHPTGVATVVVADPVEALGRLAHAVLERLPGVSVVALTGSQGKTGTKDLLAAVLADEGTTVATAGNANNEIGVPLTILRADSRTRYLVLEMGARGIGHIAYLCGIARPDVAIVVNVGTAHLGEFGTRQDIARAKGEIVEAVPAAGYAVLNADDPLVAAMAGRAGGTVLDYGRGPDVDVRVTRVELDDFDRPRFLLTHAGKAAEVHLNALGGHQADNAAAAATAAIALGVPLDRVAGSLSRARPASRWRMELTERSDGVSVINDAYNASPDTMRAALETLARIGARRGSRTIAVLGEMRELGAASESSHAEVGRLAQELRVDRLVVVGDRARAMYDAAAAVATAPDPVHASTVEEAVAWLRDNVAAPDVVLVKASRAGELEKVAEALMDDVEETGR